MQWFVVFHHNIYILWQGLPSVPLSAKKGNFSFVIGDNKLKKLVLKGKSLSAIKVLPDLVICRSKATI